MAPSDVNGPASDDGRNGLIPDPAFLLRAHLRRLPASSASADVADVILLYGRPI